MKNFIEEGATLALIAPAGGVVSGRAYQIGQLVVVAAVTAAAGAEFSGKTSGVFDVLKAGTQAWTEGAIVYFDKENGVFTSVAAGSRRAGYAVRPLPGAGAGETTGRVFLVPTVAADEA